MISFVMLGVWILTISICVQIVASIVAIRLAFVTRIFAWSLFSLAILLMALRRSNALSHSLANGTHDQIDVGSETIALVVSGLLLTAVLWIGPLFTRIKAELDISQESFQSMFESFPLGIAICRVIKDTQGRVGDYELLKANVAFWTLFGEDLKPIAGVHPRGSQLAERIPYLEEFGDVDGSSTPLRKETHCEASGRYFRIVAYSLKNGCFAVVYEDFSDRKQAQLSLQELNEKLEEAQSLGKSGWWEYDVPNDRINWPEATYELFDMEPGSLLNYETLLGRIKPEYRDYHDEQMRFIYESGVAEFEYPICTSDGRERWILGKGEADFSEDGKPVRLFGTLQDVTVSKEAERLRDDLDRVMHHDLRSPLSTVYTISDLLEAQCDNEESRELAGVIKDSTQRMIRQVNMSLDLFRIEDGRYELIKSPVSIGDLLQEVLVDLKPVADAQQVAFRVSDASQSEGVPLRDVVGEPSLCYSILFNLMKNAAEASTRGDEVDVRISQLEDELEVCIRNSIPVPQDLRTQLFSKYKTAAKKTGIGLGAYAARLMVEIQGGSIELDSSETKGTTITVNFISVPKESQPPPELPQIAR